MTLSRKSKPPHGFFKHTIVNEDFENFFTSLGEFLSVKDLYHFSLVSKTAFAGTSTRLKELKDAFIALKDETDDKKLATALLKAIELEILTHEGFKILEALIKKKEVDQAILNGSLLEKDYQDYEAAHKNLLDGKDKGEYGKIYIEKFLTTKNHIEARLKKLRDILTSLLKKPLEDKFRDHIHSLDLRMGNINVVLSDLDFNDVSFSKEFGCDITINGSTFENAKFNQTNFNKFYSNHSSFKKAIFNQIKASLTTLDKCDLSEAQFNNCDLLGMTFRNVDFDKTNFIGTNLTRARLEDCTFNDVIFFAADPKVNSLITKLYNLWKEKKYSNELKNVIDFFYRQGYFSKKDIENIKADSTLTALLRELIAIFPFSNNQKIPLNLLVAVYGENWPNILQQNNTLFPNFDYMTIDGIGFSDLRVDDLYSHESNFNNCEFKDGKIHNARFYSPSFNKCDFGNIDFENVTFHNANFLDSNFTRFNKLAFYDSHLENVNIAKQKIADVKFYNCELFTLNLADCEFTNMTLNETKVYNTNFTNAKFNYQSTLQNSQFYLCDFTNVDFMGFQNIRNNNAFYACKLPFKNLLSMGSHFDAEEKTYHMIFHKKKAKDDCIKNIIKYASAYREELHLSLIKNPFTLFTAIVDRLRDIDVFARYKNDYEKSTEAFERILNALMCKTEIQVNDLLFIKEKHAKLWTDLINLDEKQMPSVLKQALIKLDETNQNKSMKLG